jgi:hypothetical protein
MRNTFFALCIIFTNLITANAQQKQYDVSQISKDILPYASAVVREQEVSIDVKDLNTTLYHIKEVVTILNKNGDVFANIGVYHDNTHSIKYIKGATYNSFGIQTGKFSESDFEDINTTDGFSLFEDVKVKHYTPHIVDYPYTIEYEYELRIKGTLAFPDWRPNNGTGIAVEKSSLKFSCKPDFNIRYKEINIPSGVSVQTDKDEKTYTWQVNNLKAIKFEPFSPNDINYLSIVKIAPQKFIYYDIPGSFNNWDELGKWEYDNLIANRQELPEETKNRMIDLTKDITDPKLKAKKIFEYMQAKTHYVSVQVGIGGHQPFLASDVDKLNYGDCKALVNYTQALLKSVGIESYYCVVEANTNSDHKISFDKDFATLNQGNHIILCLPFKNDTTWCDCTSQTAPFGYLGSFTDDRTVLACTPQGGKLLHTPKYTTVLSRKANFTISDSGDLSGDVNTVYTGTDYFMREGVIAESPVERLKMMQNIYPINNLNIEKLDFKQDKGLQPATTETMKIKAPEFASTDNGKIIFSLNPISRITNVPKQVFNRTRDVYINEGFTDEDEYTYTIPAGYHLDNKIIHRTIEKPFGKYTATMRVEGNQLVYNRKLELINGTYSKEIYQDLVDFYQSAADEDSHNVILVKNN